MTRECWHDCGRPAVIFNPDGRARCRPCQREHEALVRAVRAHTARIRPAPRKESQP